MIITDSAFWDKTFAKAESNSKDESERIYLQQYPLIIRSFAEMPLNEHSITVMAMSVYGWMPTILKRSDRTVVPQIIEVLERARAGNINEILVDMELFAKFMNNSYVGASKFLHFFFPAHFPIWDSRVANTLEIKNHNNLLAYIQYRNFLLENVPAEIIDRAKKLSMPMHDNYEIKNIRAVEHCLFMAGKKAGAEKNG